MTNKSILNPVFYEKTKNGEVFYDIQSRLIKDRVIFLCEPVTQDVAGVMCALLFMLNNEDPQKKISLWINTPGGDAHAFLAIYDMMQMIQAPIETVCIGIAMSAGSLLLASGSRGMRLATPNSSIMIHQLQVGNLGGTGTEVEIETEQIKKNNACIQKILADHSGQSLEQVKTDCIHNKYLTAKEALEYGIIDKIIPMKKAPVSHTRKPSAKKTSKKKKVSKKTV